jgi:hypothetical protein
MNPLLSLHARIASVTGSINVQPPAAFDFDANDGTNTNQDAVDQSPVPRTLTWVGGSKVTNVQSRDGGLSLDVNSDAGSDDYITFPKIDFGTDDFTIETYVRAQSFDGTFWRSPIGNFLGSEANSWSMWIKTTGAPVPVFRVAGSPDVVGTSRLLTNTWYHVAVCRSAGTVRLFLDGVFQQSQNYAAVSMHGTADIFLGGNNNGVNERWRGWIDKVKIFNGVAQYKTDARFVPPPKPAISNHIHWRLRFTNAGGFSGGALADVGFFSDVAGTTLVSTGGTPTAGTAAFGGTASAAFDRNLSNFWAGASNSIIAGISWVAYQHPSPVSVRRFEITGRFGGDANQVPDGWVLEYSDNGTDWFVQDTYLETAAWSDNQTKTFFVS